jgi:RTX calcium-binding nonapeptide repeat (4 copies)
MSLALWNAKQTVNTTTAFDQSRPSITKLADGSLVVAWADQSSSNFDIKFQRFDAIGNKVGGETTAHLASASDQLACDVTALSGGGFVVSYVDVQASIFYGQKYLANGTVNGGPIALSNPTYQLFGEYREGPIIQALANDEFVAIYTTNNFASGTSGTDLVGRVVNAAGVPQGAFAIMGTAADTQYSPSVSQDLAGNLVVVWTTGSGSATDIVGRHITSTGGPLTSDFGINTAFIGTQDNAEITRLSNGLHVVTWSTDTQGNTGFDIHGQVIDAVGNLYGTEFLVSGSTYATQDTSKIAALADGKFLVVYQDANGNLGQSLHAQLFNPNGTMAGSEITLTNSGSFAGVIPDVVTLDDGRVAVVWPDELGDGSGDAIVMQIIDPREGSFTGTANADKIYGHNGNVDFISGGNGADIIYGLAGADTIYGDAGSDQLYDGRGDDTVYGGADGDYLYGDLGDDQLFGGDGNDSIYSFGGADLMDGGAGTGDSVFYVNERSAVTINLVDQILNAGAAFGDTIVNIERIYGAVYFANNLTGDNNSNILVGGIQSDIMNGGGGFDILRGGLGADTMTGGTSGDYFQYTAVAEGGDTITDWTAGDKFTFARAAFGNLAGANVAAVNFLSVASGHVATTAAQRFIFDQATDQLWYDADGNAGGAAVFIADITTNYNILNTDLLLA